MKFEEFKTSMADELPPRGITSSLAALWYAGKADWEQEWEDIVKALLQVNHQLSGN